MRPSLTSADSKDCAFAKTCGGCDNWTEPYDLQLSKKLQRLTEICKGLQNESLPQIQVLSVGDRNLRDRMELSFDSVSKTWGFYEKTDHRHIQSVSDCLMISPELRLFFQDFKKFTSENPFPFTKANLRLRVFYWLSELQNSKPIRRGIWMDLPNVTIKDLLANKTYLNELLKICDTVELGQKRKIISQLTDGSFKLTQPEARPWFSTWIEAKEIQLHTSVGAFTQPSLKANRLLIQTLEDWMQGLDIKSAIEFGSGCGNLSFPISNQVKQLLCLEIDEVSIQGMKKTLMTLQNNEVAKDKIDILQGDFQKNSSRCFSRDSESSKNEFDFIAVNPPRSGLKDFTAEILKLRPKFLFYMSCYPESFEADCQHFTSAGYKFKNLALLDQFPHTKHFEVLSLFQLTE